jgi:hypothetical protein
MSPLGPGGDGVTAAGFPRDRGLATTAFFKGAGLDGKRGSPYGSTPQGGSLAGSTGSFTAGQIVPQNVPITNQYAGTGIAYINGQRVLVDTNTNRVLRPY